ncbi:MULTISPECIES: alpha/beta fold hydrolase [unclassified Streptomyces]|uniref:alpha/beta hydrolase n=1 Tax=unclassified Streptomyces TaxID=2593676 RepID=UPI0016557121|nr:alpha/beta fold hydrolase [Streptomyces sp. CB02980]MCB8902065.1 alpha/beta fold hydrolase [Streptomyces sp. CB02980]
MNATPAPDDGFAPLTLTGQGSFAVGGTTRTTPGAFDPRRPTDPAGQTLHGDHARVFYQIPVDPRPLPLVLWHGYKQCGSGWGSTPDGREGFQTIFLRRGFPVYTLDQPRRASAGQTTQAAPVDTATTDQWFYNQFRFGLWPDRYPGGQFPPGDEALEQFFRSMVPDTGPIDADVLTASVEALFDRIGPGVLVTHSHAGGFGWLAAMRSPGIRGVVALEPGSGFVFPEGETPDPMDSSAGTMAAVSVPLAEFERLTKIPIVVYYGDNIPTEPTDIAGRDNWRIRVAMARLWVDAVNRHGGDARLVLLPEAGITGNSHFLHADLNNLEIAGQISAFLVEKNLD